MKQFHRHFHKTEFLGSSLDSFQFRGNITIFLAGPKMYHIHLPRNRSFKTMVMKLQRYSVKTALVKYPYNCRGETVVNTLYKNVIYSYFSLSS